MHIRMDWKNVSFDWNRARAFLVTAEEGSLSAAARALGLAQPTLGRQVEALQEELGVTLFERAGRGMQLTPAGHAMIEHARAMGEAAGRLSNVAFGQNHTMEGPVTISASDAYAGLLLPPIIEKMTEAEPRITVNVVVSNTASDLLRREADIAIRNFRPEEPDLIARKIRDAEARMFASPDYAASLGPIQSKDDFAKARFVGLDRTGQFLGMLQQMGYPISEANVPVHTENFLVMWALVKRGMGIGMIDSVIGDADPGVVRLWEDEPTLGFPIWLVAHRDLHQNRRLRFVWDFLADALR